MGLDSFDSFDSFDNGTEDIINNIWKSDSLNLFFISIYFIIMTLTIHISLSILHTKVDKLIKHNTFDTSSSNNRNNSSLILDLNDSYLVPRQNVDFNSSN